MQESLKHRSERKRMDVRNCLKKRQRVLERGEGHPSGGGKGGREYESLGQKSLQVMFVGGEKVNHNRSVMESQEPLRTRRKK